MTPLQSVSMPDRLRRLVLAAAIVCLLLPDQAVFGAWWKGNLHTHTLWSDGDDFPEMVADWYKNHGYQFLGLSDHNLLQAGEKWVNATNVPGGTATLERYRSRFGAFWVTEALHKGSLHVRLKTLEEFRPLLEERGRFLFIPATEVTTQYKIWPVHVNATNIRTPFSAPSADSVLDAMQRCVDMVLRQREATGQPMFPHINHPNFGWAVTAEDLSQVRGERFFEVYNGHPGTYSFGDGTRLGVEKIWDVALALRLSRTQLGPLYALAVDDSHRYHKFAPGESNPGRGWIMVRAPRLEPGDIVAAMERGDFYASTGVKLAEVRRESRRLVVQVAAEPGVQYAIRFYGTPKGFDPSSEPILAKDGRPYPTTRRYGPEVGALLKEVQGPAGSYELTGAELYVRASIVSSKVKEHPQAAGEHERAWSQPLVASP
jgi:hypothetical protein